MPLMTDDPLPVFFALGTVLRRPRGPAGKGVTVGWLLLLLCLEGWELLSRVDAAELAAEDPDMVCAGTMLRLGTAAGGRRISV